MSNSGVIRLWSVLNKFLDLLSFSLVSINPKYLVGFCIREENIHTTPVSYIEMFP